MTDDKRMKFLSRTYGRWVAIQNMAFAVSALTVSVPTKAPVNPQLWYRRAKAALRKMAALQARQSLLPIPMTYASSGMRVIVSPLPTGLIELERARECPKCQGKGGFPYQAETNPLGINTDCTRCDSTGIAFDRIAAIR